MPRPDRVAYGVLRLAPGAPCPVGFVPMATHGTLAAETSDRCKVDAVAFAGAGAIPDNLKRVALYVYPAGSLIPPYYRVLQEL